jgi:WhiB family redox-sensing transcriptional regulator
VCHQATYIAVLTLEAEDNMSLLDIRIETDTDTDTDETPWGVLDPILTDRVDEVDEHDEHDEHDADQQCGSRYARCADGNGTLTHLFFSDDQFDIARAKAICEKCGLSSTCLRDALDRAEPYGVWGGELLVDGAVVAIKRGRGRPPKTPRPPLVVDEVPLPPHLVA